MALPSLSSRHSASSRLRLAPGQADACVDFLRRLVQTPSLSGQEAAVARQVEAEMRRLQYTDVRVDRIGNIIGRYGKSGGPILLLNGHMDTVGIGNPGAWTHDPFGGEIIDGYLYGRGSVDMKGPLAAMIHGVGLLAEQGVELPGEVIVAAVVQEEPTEGMAMRVLVEEEDVRPDWIVLGEPTNLQVAHGQRGRMEIKVEVSGRSCHASEPDAGDNALSNAARLIFGLNMLGANLMTDAILGKGTLAVTQLTTVAGSRNVIPDRCDMIIDRRLTLGETPSRALTEVETALQREDVRGKVEISQYRSVSYSGYETSGPEIYPAWLLPEDHPLLRRSCDSLEHSLGRRPPLRTWAFSTDGVYTMGEAGIPTVGFGPGESRQAHTSNEHILIDDVKRAAQSYAALVIDLLQHLVRARS